MRDLLSENKSLYVVAKGNESPKVGTLVLSSRQKFWRSKQILKAEMEKYHRKVQKQWSYVIGGMSGFTMN
jgi:hypothetical protein